MKRIGEFEREFGWLSLKIGNWEGWVVGQILVVVRKVSWSGEINQIVRKRTKRKITTRKIPIQLNHRSIQTKTAMKRRPTKRPPTSSPPKRKRVRKTKSPTRTKTILPRKLNHWIPKTRKTALERFTKAKTRVPQQRQRRIVKTRNTSQAATGKIRWACRVAPGERSWDLKIPCNSNERVTVANWSRTKAERKRRTESRRYPEINARMQRALKIQRNLWKREWVEAWLGKIRAFM